MLTKICKIYAIASALLIFNTGMDLVAHAAPPPKNENEASSESTCPPKEPEARSVLETFIFPGPNKTPAWASERLAGKGNTLPELGDISSRSQIQALTDPEDSETCSILNTRYSEELSDKWATPAGSDETWYAYDIGYFKADEFYFVVMTPTKPPQPNDPNLVTVTTARKMIDVLDISLNPIRSY